LRVDGNASEACTQKGSNGDERSKRIVEAEHAKTLAD
jgi:hypothetical protein